MAVLMRAGACMRGARKIASHTGISAAISLARRPSAPSVDSVRAKIDWKLA
jgi:hypothetical protein